MRYNNYNSRRISKHGKTTIIDSLDEKIVYKPIKKDLRNLYNYLNSRDFSNYAKILDEDKNNYFYEYIGEVDTPVNQKIIDMAHVVAQLHYKTAYFKPLVIDEVKELYESIYNNILYFEQYYNELFNKIEEDEYMSPSSYLLIRNRTKINSLVLYQKRSLEKWYRDVLNEDKIRIVCVHNNLSIDHFLENKYKYLISWDNYTKDIPVLDIINLYHNDYGKYNFKLFLEEYLKYFELSKTEVNLLFLMISIPNIKYICDNEMENTINISKMIDQINETDDLIKSLIENSD